MSFALHCHFTLASGFSVSASKTTDDPAAASRVFGFLVNAESTYGGWLEKPHGVHRRNDYNFLMVAHRDYTSEPQSFSVLLNEKTDMGHICVFPVDGNLY